MRIITTLIFLAIWAASASAVTLDPFAQFDVEVYRPTVAEIEELDTSDLPFESNVIVIDYSEDNWAATEVNLTPDNMVATFDHERGDYDARVLSDGYVIFTVDRLTEYVISGFYDCDNTSKTAHDLHAELENIMTGEILFSSWQQSYDTRDPEFILGEMNGDTYNHLEGTPIGLLVPGDRYRFTFTAWEGQSGSSGSKSTSWGEVSIDFVPEPDTFVLHLAAIAMLAHIRQRRK